MQLIAQSNVGAQAAVWKQLRDARANGLAVLLISADLEELIGLSDTLLVIFRGRIVAQLDPQTITPSLRTERRRFTASSVPMRSPIPRGPADSVANKRLPVSELIKTSVNGHAPTAAARREAYRNGVQRAG